MQDRIKIASLDKKHNKYIGEMVKANILKEIHDLKAKLNPLKKALDKIEKDKTTTDISITDNNIKQLKTNIDELWENYILNALEDGYLPLVWQIVNKHTREVGEEFYPEFKSAFCKIAEDINYFKIKPEQKKWLFVNADLTGATLNNVVLTSFNLANACLRETTLIDPRFTFTQLLSARSIEFIKINDRFHKTRNWDKNTAIECQRKILTDLELVINTTADIDQLINISEYIEKDSILPTYREFFNSKGIRNEIICFDEYYDIYYKPLFLIADKVLRLLLGLTIEERSIVLKNSKIRDLIKIGGQIYIKQKLGPMLCGYSLSTHLEAIFSEACLQNEPTWLFSSGLYLKEFLNLLKNSKLNPPTILFLDLRELSSSEPELTSDLDFSKHQLERAEFSNLKRVNFTMARLYDVRFNFSLYLVINFCSLQHLNFFLCYFKEN